MIRKGIRITSLMFVFAALIFIIFRSNIRLQSTSFLKKYTAEELKYFGEVGFGDSDRLTKWNKKIQVQILPPFQKADSLEVDKIIDEIRPLIGKIDIVWAREKGNVLINFPRTAEEFNSHRPADLYQEPKGYASATLHLNGNLRKVDIYIMPYLNGKGKWETLRHELCHAVGLMGHSKRRFQEPHLLGVTVFTSFDVYENDLDLPSSLPEAERRAIQLLYEDSLPPNLSRKKFIKAFGEVTKNKTP